MKSKCCNAEVKLLNKGTQVGVYCTKCGKWQKWANKDDIRAIEMSNENIPSKDTFITEELLRLINQIDSEVTREDGSFPKSDLDAIRKSSKIYELEHVKWSLRNILDGRKFDDEM